MQENEALRTDRAELLQEYQKVRAYSETLCEPLAEDDFQIQSIPEVSPPKWHLAHVSWFFETFLLKHYGSEYQPFHPQFEYLFNSYYETVGAFHPRPKRGLLSRPTVDEVYQYRAYVDEQMLFLMETIGERYWQHLAYLVTLGLQHEQQHQELLLMDIKHNFGVNPLRPAYRSDLVLSDTDTFQAPQWLECPGGIGEMGYAGDGFAYDNETPRHQVLLCDYRIADRPVTNGEFRAFIDDGGYQRPELWLADGWATLHREGWSCPLYWEEIAGEWYEMTLGGLRPLNPGEPVCHVSFYEAEAYARWTAKRLPSEAELENVLRSRPLVGNFVETESLHPLAVGSRGQEQWYGDVWEWTQSAYAPYPGFKPLAGSIGEYNGKFMCNQMVLRGGSCVTSASHLRPTYRNFFYPHDRWQFSGIRLAEDA